MPETMTGLASVQPRAFRKARNRWLAYGTEIAAPALRGISRLSARGPRTEPTAWRNGLILGHTHIGDVLYRTCSLAELRTALPNCEWTYAVSEESAAVLANNPHISDALPVIRGENSWTLAPGAYRELSRRRFDVVLCTNTLRHHPDLALATALRIPNRVGFIGKGFSGLVNHPVQLRFPDRYAAYFRSMVATVTGTQTTWPLKPRMYPSTPDDTEAQRLWASFELGSRPVVACSLRTRQAHGNWPQDVLLSVVTAARGTREIDVVLCGGADDAPAMQALAATLPYPAHVLAGRATILPFAAFLTRCSALLTLDSGPRHIGNAMGVPVVFARNLSHSRVEAGAYCETEVDLAPDVEYLSPTETERVARAQPIDRMAAALLACVSASDTRASTRR